MTKSAKKVKNSLKFQAFVKSGALSVRIGLRKYVLPVPVRLLSDGDYVFLSFPASSELYRIRERKLVPMGPDEDATEAYQQLKPRSVHRKRRRRSAVTLPPQLEEALRAIPAGYKLGYDANGQPRLIKKRTRRRKAGMDVA